VYRVLEAFSLNATLIFTFNNNNNNNLPLFRLRQTTQRHNRLSHGTATTRVRHGPCVTRGSYSFTCHPHVHKPAYYSTAF